MLPGSQSHRPSDGFRADIEGLRGIAVLLVVLYHARVPFMGGGFIGVDIFFVISGYLITGLLIREASETGRIHFAKFYARRARRLLPAASLTILVTIAAGYFIYAAYEQLPIIKTAITAALYSCNIYFAHHATDYLAPDAKTNPFLHMWSLAVEEQFYLVWPLVIWLAFRAWPGKAVRRLPLLLGAIAVASFAACLWLTYTAQPWAFFSSPTRAWEFAIGGLAQFGVRRVYPRICAALPVLALLALIAGSAVFSATTRFPGFAALVPVLGSAVLLHFHTRQQGVRWLLENPASQFLGRVSYSWYLWHWPVLVLSSALWTLTLTDRLVCALASLLMAALTYQLLENPIRFHPALMGHAWRSLAMAVCVTGISLSACAATAYLRHHLQTPRSRYISATIAALPVVYSDGCHLTYTVSASPDCSFADTASKTTVVLFGDSHAAQWFPAIERIANENHWRLVSLTKSACTISSTPIIDKALHKTYTECSDWRDSALKRIAAMHPALVILTDYTTLYLSEGLSVPEWGSGLRTTVSRLNDAGVQTLLLHDPPAPEEDPDTCLARAARIGRSFATCTYRRDLTADAPIQAAERQAVQGLPHVQRWNITSDLCHRLACSPYENGTVVYRDTSHFTVSFALTLAPLLQPEVDAMVTDPRSLTSRPAKSISAHL
ncbi:acyltransferase family protein [Paracidobacterium acidisoli]|uniref:Acyltransferase n=1 Tax=Paracidobacterium acidisoli TaxID=2303751 RepID=A0A372IUS6_9BACT|nr:acyltransferase family protein [Paracidobacterium acidisoli]MBT9330017.1 acyltransferase [Paracidobacterium acidisoli]